MLEELYMRDLANAMRMPEEVVPAGTVTVSAPDPEMAGMDKAFVGTRLNVPKPGQPTEQDREKMAIGLLDTLAGALRGAAAQVGGLPGDIRSILDMINQEGAEKYLGQRSFATTEEILADTSVRIPGTQIDVPFPPVLKEGVPNREERQGAVETAQEVGTFLPAPGVPEAVIQGGKLVGKAIKATKNMPVGMSIQDVSGADIAIPKAPKIESKAFKNWFGKSKVVDENSKPIVVYHGTKDDIEQFMKGQPNKKDAGWLGDGFYFTDNPELASTYAQYLKSGPEGANVLPVYLSIKNPYEATIRDKEYLMMADRRGDKAALKEFTDNLIKQGYDGVVLDYKKQMGVTDPVKEYVAFKPEQIKSVFNKGEFDPTNPNMLLGAGGAGVAATQEENK
jgi:hypothetical protein